MTFYPGQANHNQPAWWYRRPLVLTSPDSSYQIFSWRSISTIPCVKYQTAIPYFLNGPTWTTKLLYQSTNPISSLTSSRFVAHSAAKRFSQTAFQRSFGTSTGLVRCNALPKSMVLKIGVVKERSIGGRVSGPGCMRMLRINGEFCTKRTWWRRWKRE